MECRNSKNFEMECKPDGTPKFKKRIFGRVRAKPETRNISSSEMSEKIRRILERMAGAQRAE